MNSNMLKVIRFIFIVVFISGLLFPTGLVVRADDAITPEVPTESTEVVVQPVVPEAEVTPELPVLETTPVSETKIHLLWNKKM